MKLKTTFLFCALALFATAQNVNIPDAIFKAYLVGNSAINTNGDSEIQVSEATVFNGTIACSNSNISDLTGIEAFVNLTKLYCSYNVLTSLNVSANTALTELFCGYQPLTTLDVSANTALTRLSCAENPLVALDVSTNTALTQLNVSNTNITTLDLSQNVALEKLWCYSNSLLTSLDVSANTNLRTLICYYNDLTCLNVANGNNGNISSNLYYIKAYGNPRLSCIQKDTGYDPTTNSNWQKDATASWSDDCQTTTIGVSTNTVSFGNVTVGNTVTQEVTISNLSCLDLTISNFVLSGSSSFSHNGINNTTITAGETYTFTVTFTPTNTATETATIDIVNNSSTPSQIVNIDGTGTNDCIVYIPDTNFKNYLLSNTAINTVNDGEIDCTEAQNFTGQINCNSMSISNLTGIEAFLNLTQLRCQSNNITTLDVSQNTALTQLRCSSNNLTTLDVSQNTALTQLNCSGNNLTTLDVSQNTALTQLYCSNNNLTALDVSANTALTLFYCNHNTLTSLDMSANTALTILYCYSNALTTLNVSANTALQNLQCNDNALTNLDVSANTALIRLYCNDNALPSLDVSANTALIRLYCHDNALTTLDVSANTSLQRLYCNDNQLQSLNVANGNNSNMSYMKAHNNPNLACIQHDTGFDPTANSNWQKDSTASWGDYCCQVTFGSDIQEHCESFTWIDGNTYTQDTTGVQDTLVNAAGCDSIVTLNLTINTPPTVSISESNGTLIFSGADSIEWYFNGALIPSENGDSLVLENLGENNGDYYAVGYSTSNCADTSNTISMVGLNVIENSWSNFTMYPNPTTGTVEIQSNTTVEKIEIINNLGQKIGAFKQSQFDISELKNGIYFVKVTTEIGTTTKRLIKQ